MLHFGIRDQNLELKIGISDEKIYLVTTLLTVACEQVRLCEGLNEVVALTADG